MRHVPVEPSKLALQRLYQWEATAPSQVVLTQPMGAAHGGEVRERGGEAAPVLLWLRREATLAKGLRGLYCDAGSEFASAEQRDAWGLDAEKPTAEHLAARRDGAYAHGRRMVLAAAAVWEQVMRERGTR